MANSFLSSLSMQIVSLGKIQVRLEYSDTSVDI